MPGGRPKLLITDEMLAKARRYAAQGLTKTQIAPCLHMSLSTLMERQKEYPELLEAIKEGQAEGIKEISNALFDSAVEGNITAQIFYLKNRSPNEWRDRREHVIETADKKPIDMSDEELMAELRGHKEEAVGSNKTTH